MVIRYLLIVCFLGSIVSCGGGGSRSQPPPTITLIESADVESNRVTVKAQFNPNGGPAWYDVEYWSSTDSAVRTGRSTSHTGHETILVSVSIDNATCGKVYRYQFWGGREGSDGSARGEPGVFETPACSLGNIGSFDVTFDPLTRRFLLSWTEEDFLPNVDAIYIERRQPHTDDSAWSFRDAISRGIYQWRDESLSLSFSGTLCYQVYGVDSDASLEFGKTGVSAQICFLVETDVVDIVDPPPLPPENPDAPDDSPPSIPPDNGDDDPPPDNGDTNPPDNGEPVEPPLPITGTITLEGATTITLAQYEPFEEPGYTAQWSDNSDATVNVVVVGVVDITQPDTYIRVYTLSHNGSVVAQVTRTIIVEASGETPQDTPTAGYITLADPKELILPQNTPVPSFNDMATWSTGEDATSSLVTTRTVNPAVVGFQSMELTLYGPTNSIFDRKERPVMVVPQESAYGATLSGSGYLAVPSSTLLRQAGMTEGVLEIEILPSVGECYTMVSQGDAVSATLAFLLQYCNTGGSYVFVLTVSSDGNNLVTRYVTYTLLPYPTHLALVMGTGSAEMIVNGFSLGEITGLPTSLYESSADIVIGARLDSAGAPLDPFVGTIGDVRLWSDRKTLEEIRSSLFSSPPSTTGLLADWPLIDDGEDFSPNNNTLSPVGNIGYVGGDVPLSLAPILTFVGANPLQIQQGINFVDPGCTAVDYLGNVITHLVQKGGDTVSTATVGATFTRTCNVTDWYGTPAQEISRQVIIVDAPPVVVGSELSFAMDGPVGSVQKRDNGARPTMNLIEIGSVTSADGFDNTPQGAYALYGESCLKVDTDDNYNPGSESITITAWINTSQGVTQAIVTGTNAGTRNFVNVLVLEDKIHAQLGFRIDSSNQSVGGFSTRTITDGAWHRVDVIFFNDGVAKYEIWIDRVLDASGSHSTYAYNLEELSSGWHVGALENWLNGNVGSFFQGEVDSVSITEGIVRPAP